MRKRIACIGWGSLVWDHRDLPVVGEWMIDGPMLPIEFARESRDGRVTLVLCEGSRLVQACWSLISVEDVSVAIEVLAARESISKNIAKNIGWWNSVDGKAQGTCAAEIEAWAKALWLEGVVWTNLRCGLKKNWGVMPTEAQVLAHIEALEGEAKENALNYIVRAPEQIDTQYRKAILRAFRL